MKGDYNTLFSRWKVLLSDRFLKSFKKLPKMSTKKKVLNLLLKLSSGWRPNNIDVNVVCGNSTQILKQFKIKHLCVICAIDIATESTYVQVLKVWDILPLEDVSKLIKHLDRIFFTYTDEYINLCQEMCYQGKLEIPMTWEFSSKLVRHKSQINDSNEGSSQDAAYDDQSYVENSKVKDSLLLMKFYSLSFGVVSHLLSGRDVSEFDLPFEVTDEELEIILYQRSAFILGRSGTGKTTVLTMKLFQKEKLYNLAVESYGVKDSLSLEVNLESEILENPVVTNGTFLCQLFVTVNPTLCYAVRQHVSHWKSYACGGNITTASFDMENMDDLEAQFMDVPDSLANLPHESFPLVITFYKFLMMLDGTLRNTYFERFCDAKQLLHGQISSSRSDALRTFLRKEVTYDRFSSSYWPRFNTQLTKKLDCSRVFTEIISHIKGDVQTIDTGNGKLSRVDYLLLSEGRVSNLTKQEREIIYDIFQSYEKLKMTNREFDLADFVIDLHRRLRDQGYRGKKMDFVYIDEVQDLTMSQIALFNYVCENVEEGFIFSGDTAQTIARGVNFRFQDIKFLFYKKFVLPKRSSRGSEREDKGQISEIFHLSQNFRTHARVLHLSQSIIDLLYHFFPQSIDILKPETSNISGERPVLLDCVNKENAMKMMFGNRSDGCSKVVGFGAEQVILVRDNPTKKEVVNYVEKKALVLTILECKGLEFQDVLLYNFFGSSPMKNEWRVIYKYMEEQHMLDSSLSQSLPQFKQSKHGILCSELKQLYVAVTRTRQRLWFCEDEKEHSGPMFVYWNKKCAVQVQQLNHSLVESMQVSSSKEEWRSKGIKLYHEHNYNMATLCFEKAGDVYWERISKASGLITYAESINSKNPKGSRAILTEADAFFRAGEYFLLAKCYDQAADAFARGNFFAECLNTCTKAQLFDFGLSYIISWKHAFRHGTQFEGMDNLKQDFLEKCARYYHSRGDNRSMMKSVKVFSSVVLMRKLLKSLNCVNELILLEEELGNFYEAYMLSAADLLGKSVNFNDPLMLLQYVLAHSLWSQGSNGWPLKPFAQKEELLRKAKYFARKDSPDLYALICTEGDILSVEDGNLKTLRGFLTASKKHGSFKGEMITVRKILDIHLHLHSTEFSCEDLVSDLTKHPEEMISQNKVSCETMAYFWSCWKDGILNIFESLQTLAKQDTNPYSEFCLHFFGVWRLNSSGYILLNSEADWAKKVDKRFLHGDGKLISVDVCQFISSARIYWCSELLASGFKVLEVLESLQNSSNKLPSFSQFRLSTHIFEVSKFLLDSKNLNHGYEDKLTLDGHCKRAIQKLQSYLFAPNWNASLEENVISLRLTGDFQNLLKEVIAQNVYYTYQPTYGFFGRIVMLNLGSGKLDKKLSEEIMNRYFVNRPWSGFIQELHNNISAENRQGLKRNYSRDITLVSRLCDALSDTYSADWLQARDYISPFCFLYLVEHLVITMSSFQGHFITTKSSFVEWLIFHQGNSRSLPISGAPTQRSFQPILRFLLGILSRFLFKKKDTQDWMRKSDHNIGELYPVLIQRLVVIVCLLLVNFQTCFDIFYELLNRNFITEHLPSEFCNALKGKEKSDLPLDEIAEFFKGIENPMVIVSSDGKPPRLFCKDTIFVDMKSCHGIKDILTVLFPKQSQNIGFWDIFVALKQVFKNASQVKMDLEKRIRSSTEARSKEELETALEDGELILLEVDNVIHELKSLSAALSMSEPERNISEVGPSSKSLSSKLAKLLHEDCKTKAAVGKFDAENDMAGEEACNGSSNGETAEPEEQGEGPQELNI